MDINESDQFSPLKPLPGSILTEGWRTSEPLITIACITYNHFSYIKDALNGFLAQRCEYPFEIIIRDDASFDGTTEIVHEYKNEYPEIIQTVTEKENTFNDGVYPLSRVLPMARGKYIALCEGDDYWTDPYKLEK